MTVMRTDPHAVLSRSGGQHGAAPHRILIAGAGVAALEAMLALRHLAGDRVEIDLLAATPDFVYRPLGVVEPFGEEPSEHRLPLRPIAREYGAGHVFDNVESVDAEARRVRGTSGAEYGYDALLVAVGARRVDAVPGAVAFHGPAAGARYRRVLDDVAEGRVRSLAFVVPPGPVWPLPAYELAMLTAAWSWQMRLTAPRLTVVTPEASPLEVFGPEASLQVAGLLERSGVEFRGGAVAAGSADVTIALPRLAGPWVDGLPSDGDGFIKVDQHGRVTGCPNVFAAGDGANWPVKFGGLATEQADAVAESIASWAGAPVRPTPYQPVLRAMLLAGEERLYLRADSRAGRTRSAAREKPLWWPNAKVAGKYLAPYLAAHGLGAPTTV
jgi:sulfide:quinone oxidoreductase